MKMRAEDRARREWRHRADIRLEADADKRRGGKRDRVADPGNRHPPPPPPMFYSSNQRSAERARLSSPVGDEDEHNGANSATCCPPVGSSCCLPCLDTSPAAWAEQRAVRPGEEESGPGGGGRAGEVRIHVGEGGRR